jgi:4-hydroxybenzoate polyprenyltransferase
LKLKAAAVMGIILVSLIPVYLLYKYLQVKMRPRESGQRFFLWLLTCFVLIFGYTFLVVLTIKLLFPAA